MAARIDRGRVQLLTRTGLDWTAKYPATAASLVKIPVKTAYIDGELCGVRPDGVTSLEIIQQAADGGGALVYYAFDLIEFDGADVAALALLERKERRAAILRSPGGGGAYREHEGGDGEAFRRAACRHGLEGVVSKRIDRHYLPGDRGVWLKSKCLCRAEFVIVGWSEPEGSRHGLGALLLGYYEADGRLPTPAASEPACRSGHSQCCMSGYSPGNPEDVARRRAASKDALRRPAGARQGPLGPPRAGRGGHLSELVPRRAAAPYKSSSA
jgi:ATP-dependent DNA ligase